MKVIETKMKRTVAVVVIAVLLFGVLPMKAEVRSRAAEQPALRNPRILKTTQEVAPGSGGQKELKNPTTENGITTWDSIWFGNYWQEDTNGDGIADKNDEKQPIKWRVLSVDGDDVFLLADKNIDAQPYNEKRYYSGGTNITWETCTIRSWLNGYGAEANCRGRDYSNDNFLNNAFAENERSAIKTTNIVNDDNKYNTKGRNDISDKVFLLSIDEVKNPTYGFTSDTKETAVRSAANTAYAAEGGEIKSDSMTSTGSSEAWWLRSRGFTTDSNIAAFVDYYGNVNPPSYVINEVIKNNISVRPALHLNLKAFSDARSTLGWSYAGTVTSDDMVEWDCVWFGNYWQRDTNGDGKADKNDDKEPIKWRVLSVNGDDAFLVADKNLDGISYDDRDAGTGVTWETCTMRSWLNGYGAEANVMGTDYSSNSFFMDAFSEGERSVVQTTNVVNSGSSKYGTEVGNDTLDQVFLLSLDEVMNPVYGFSSNYNKCNESRKVKNTGYAKDQGVLGTYDPPAKYEEDGRWWLRTLSNIPCVVAVVSYGGYLYPRLGCDCHAITVGVRPALHINLKTSSDGMVTSSWSYAGTATSEGGGTFVPAPSLRPSQPESAMPTANPDIGTTATPSGTSTSTPDVTLSPAESKKPDEESTIKPAVTAFPAGSPSPAESIKPDEGSTVKPAVTAFPDRSPSPAESIKPEEGSSVKPAVTAFPAGSPSPAESIKPEEGSSTIPTIAPTGIGTLATTPYSPGAELSQLTPALQPTAAPVPASVGKVSFVKLKQKKQTVKVSWKKVSGADGYQICYSTSKKWKKKMQKLTAGIKVEIKRLKKKKTYYFRVRAYRKDGSKKVYGAWSNTRKIRIRK